ncbi:MAG: hypothetical protein J1F31_02240 [Erysipelotrichales bacterium]|nr:hypothetical protein [Erysipelotrichales bacterium]
MNNKFLKFSLIFPVLGSFLFSCGSSSVSSSNNDNLDKRSSAKRLTGDISTEPNIVYNSTDGVNLYDFEITYPLNIVVSSGIANLCYDSIIFRGEFRLRPIYNYLNGFDDIIEYGDVFTTLRFDNIYFKYHIFSSFGDNRVYHSYDLMNDNFLTSKSKYSQVLLDYFSLQPMDYDIYFKDVVLNNYIDVFNDNLEILFVSYNNHTQIRYSYSLLEYYSNNGKLSTKTRNYSGTIDINDYYDISDTITFNNGLSNLVNSVVDYNKYVYSYGNSKFQDAYEYGKIFGFRFAVEQFESYESNFNSFDLFTNVFTSIGSLFSIEVFPGLNFGLLLSLPLVAMIIFAIIKILG